MFVVLNNYNENQLRGSTHKLNLYDHKHYVKLLLFFISLFKKNPCMYTLFHEKIITFCASRRPSRTDQLTLTWSPVQSGGMCELGQKLVDRLIVLS